MKLTVRQLRRLIKETVQTIRGPEEVGSMFDAIRSAIINYRENYDQPGYVCADLGVDQKIADTIEYACSRLNVNPDAEEWKASVNDALAQAGFPAEQFEFPTADDIENDEDDDDRF